MQKRVFRRPWLFLAATELDQGPPPTWTLACGALGAGSEDQEAERVVPLASPAD